MHRTQIYLPKSQLTALRHLANKKKTTVSEVIRSIVGGELREQGAQFRMPASKGQGLFEVLREIKKYGKLGPRDLASRLDEYETVTKLN